MLYVSKGGKGKEADGEEKEGGREREDQGEEEVRKEIDKKDRGVALKSVGEEDGQNDNVGSNPGPEGGASSGGK